MTHLRIELQFPLSFWLGRISSDFPQQFFWVLAMQRLRSGSAIAHLATLSDSADEVKERLEQEPNLVNVRILERSRTGVIFRVTYRRPILVPILEATGLLPRYPFAVRAGHAYWEILGAQRESRRFVHMLETRMPGSKVRAVFSYHAYSEGTRFTPRQHAVLQKAIEHGYYDFPRRITLTNLAKSIGVDKGSLSVMLMRIEAQLVEYGQVMDPLPRPWIPPMAGRNRS
jgi:predicted DNA binding protein